jgi:hypothetical protein
MGIVEAKIQTVEEIYQLVWAAVANRRLRAASYHGVPRLFSPHRLGRNKEGEVRVLCISTAEKAKAGLSRRVRRPTGAALYWRSSEE